MTDVNDDFELHEKNEPKPQRLERCAITMEFKGSVFTRPRVIEVKRFVRNPVIKGLISICDCGRWQQLRPCAPEDVKGQLKELGWGVSEDDEVCPVCKREGK